MIVKDVLWAGRWKYPDGTILSVDTNALDRACRNGNAMIQDGYDIKICAEHQPSAFPKTNTQWMSEISTPEKKAEFVRSIFGDAVAFTRGKNEAGRESVFAHIDDSKMSEEARRTIQAVGKVSCRLDYDLKELSEGGRKYPGLCISHIAVTPRPVNPRQGAFLMSSLSVSGNPVWNCGKTFFMAEEGVKEMKEDEDDDQGDDGDDYIPREPVIETSEAPTPAAQPTAASAISDGQDFQRLLAAMNKGWGFVPTDGVTDLKTLTIAIEAIAANRQAQQPASDPGEQQQFLTGQDAEPSQGGGVGGAGAGMMMSALDFKKSNPNRYQEETNRILKLIRKGMRQDKIPPYIGNQWIRAVNSFEMSFLNGRAASTGVVAAVEEMLRTAQPGTWRKNQAVNMSNLQPAGRPNRYTSHLGNEDEAKRIAAEFDSVIAEVNSGKK